MALTQEQVDKIKEQLMKQVEKLPEDKRDEATKQIEEMNDDDLEQLLKQQPQEQKCIFCSIIENKLPGYKIYEDTENIGILEINPLSKAHSLVVPKKHLEEVPDSSFTAAKKIAKKIKEKFKPKEIKISSASLFGHALVEIVPLYGTETQKKKATEKELEDLQKELKIEQEKPGEKEEDKPRDNAEQGEAGNPKKEKLQKIKPRIP